MNAEELSNLMKTQIVEIQFEHYRTGELITTRATLDPRYAGLSVGDHSPQSEVVAYWSLDESAWKSLYVNTIIGVTPQ